MSEENDFGESIKFYSDGQQDPVKRTGLNAQYTMTKANYPTVSIEVAPISKPRSSPNWEKKITVQLTKGELNAVCGVLFGLRKEAAGSYHGDANNKSFAVYNNGKAGVALIVSQRGEQLHHFLSADDRMEVAVFFIRRLAEAWKVSSSDAIALLRQAAWMDKHLI